DGRGVARARGRRRRDHPPHARGRRARRHRPPPRRRSLSMTDTAAASAPAPLAVRPAAECAYDVVALGEVMLRLDPGERRIRTARRFDVWEGGGEYNVARGLRRAFGLRGAIVTALADNEVGRLVEDLVLTGGLDTRWVQWRPYDGASGCRALVCSPARATGSRARAGGARGMGVGRGAGARRGRGPPASRRACRPRGGRALGRGCRAWLLLF